NIRSGRCIRGASHATIIYSPSWSAVGKGDTMRSTMRLSIAALAVGLAACSGNKASDTAKADDFKRDLQLASSTTMDLAGPKVDPALLNSLETKPQGAPQVAKTLKKGAGNRA